MTTKASGRYQLYSVDCTMHACTLYSVHAYTSLVGGAGSEMGWWWNGVGRVIVKWGYSGVGGAMS